MVQVPGATRWTVVPVGMVHVPVVRLLKVTGRPEEAVALTVKSGSPKVLPAGAPKVIVWSSLVKVTVPPVFTTGVAIESVLTSAVDDRSVHVDTPDAFVAEHAPYTLLLPVDEKV